jgi:hypothetical protein
MINDYISINSAEVIDISIDISVVIEGAQNSGQVIATIINVITEYFNPLAVNLGNNIYLSELKSNIQRLNGVISISSLDVINEVGGQYSSAQTSMAYSDEERRVIKPIDETIYAEPNQVYQIRFPEKDIRVRVLNFRNINFQ